MVCRHFTRAPGMTAAENLLLAGVKTPALIDRKAKRAALEALLSTTPFWLDLNVMPSSLAAGEKQKLELLEQRYLKPRVLILDEPASVLTPRQGGAPPQGRRHQPGPACRVDDGRGRCVAASAFHARSGCRGRRSCATSYQNDSYRCTHRTGRAEPQRDGPVRPESGGAWRQRISEPSVKTLRATA